MAKVKNSKAGNVINVIAIILAVVGCIVAFVANSVEGYALASFKTIVLLAVIGAVCAAAATAIEAMKGPQNILAFIVKWVAVFAVMIMIALIINDKVQDVSALFSWDSANEFGWKSFIICVVSIVAELLSVIFMTVAASGKGQIAD